MWFKRKKNIDLFNHPLVSKMDERITGLIKVDLITSDQEILKQLSDDEIKQSGINSKSILSVFEKFNEDLIKFICYSYHQEKKHEKNNSQSMEETSETLGLSKGFSITYAIYFHFLINDKTGLSKYLSKRKIPQFDKFSKRLELYFSQSKGVSLSDSYIQYAGGYNKEDVNANDITKALEDIKKMDEEHGAFWISMLNENDLEMIIEVNKDLNLSLIFGEEEFRYQSQGFEETKSILELHINKEFDKIKSIIKK
ncbi:hypothetical protein [Psychroserpens ponticola]|uniref:Uncharacterized protein n=1 Tax=Psychroserpens ponticola TaxID=2932268 RepID=A0ABY7S2B9_9FLAO|nr:hypothetical protein [Psychroserpens ponticola]WCO03551.1 hypothetical protein MUN68_008590 [Psychroserpens ponticola]